MPEGIARSYLYQKIMQPVHKYEEWKPRALNWTAAPAKPANRLRGFSLSKGFFIKPKQVVVLSRQLRRETKKRIEAETELSFVRAKLEHIDRGKHVCHLP